MVDTDKVKKHIDIVTMLKYWFFSTLYTGCLLSVVFKESNLLITPVNKLIAVIAIVTLSIIAFTVIYISLKRQGMIQLTVLAYVVLVTIIACGVLLNQPKWIDEVITDEMVEDNVQYDSRYDIILPNDIIKQNGLTLADCLHMSEALQKAYSDDGFDLVLYESNQQNGSILDVSVISSLNDRYVISIDLETKEISKDITKSSVVKTITEMGTPIYSYTPDEKATFESYLQDAGYTDEAAICSIEERNCCWYIYFTDNGSDKYVRVDKEKNVITESGVVQNGERVKNDE